VSIKEANLKEPLENATSFTIKPIITTEQSFLFADIVFLYKIPESID
jgi:hypothetical protein